MNVRANPKILGALIFGVGLIVVSWITIKPTAPIIDAASAIVVAEAPPRSYITPPDTDSDGVPDWEKTFQDPLNLRDLANQVASTSVFEPKTLTEKVALEVFQRSVYSASGRSGLSGEEIASLMQEEVSKQVGTDVLFTKNDIVVTDQTDPAAIEAYGNNVGTFLSQNSPNKGTSEVLILQTAVQTKNSKLLDDLVEIATYYKNLQTNLLSLPVPATVAKEHLDLINSVTAIYNDILAFQNAFNDPLQAMVRTQRYQDDAKGLYYSIQNIIIAVIKAGRIYTEQDPGYILLAYYPIE